MKERRKDKDTKEEGSMKRRNKCLQDETGIINWE